MLKEWVARENDNPSIEAESNDDGFDPEVVDSNISLLATTVCEGMNEEEVIYIDNPLLTPNEGNEHVQTNPELSNDKVKDLEKVLFMYVDVLTDVPGKTNIIEHDVKVTSNIPVRKKAYSLPYTLRDKVKNEINDMVEAGIAEKSCSPYASPIVVVPKKDGSIGLCVDYRQLNQVTIFDPEPMPKLEDVIHKLVNAKFISKLDLTKGFWQIPLTESSKEKSAFITTFGHY